jgi:hypothetical protein
MAALSGIEVVVGPVRYLSHLSDENKRSWGVVERVSETLLKVFFVGIRVEYFSYVFARVFVSVSVQNVLIAFFQQLESLNVLRVILVFFVSDVDQDWSLVQVSSEQSFKLVKTLDFLVCEFKLDKNSQLSSVRGHDFAGHFRAIFAQQITCVSRVDTHVVELDARELVGNHLQVDLLPSSVRSLEQAEEVILNLVFVSDPLEGFCSLHFEQSSQGPSQLVFIKLKIRVHLVYHVKNVDSPFDAVLEKPDRNRLHHVRFA